MYRRKSSVADFAHAAALTLLFALASGNVAAMQTGSFEPPNLARFLLISGEDADGDGDGVTETHIVHYQDTAGDKVFSMGTKGRVWAWSLQSPTAEEGAQNFWSYVIRDSDCNGTFDEKYSLEEEFHVPDCVK